MESPQTARATYVAKCGERVDGLDPLYAHESRCGKCAATETRTDEELREEFNSLSEADFR